MTCFQGKLAAKDEALATAARDINELLERHRMDQQELSSARSELQTCRGTMEKDIQTVKVSIFQSNMLLYNGRHTVPNFSMKAISKADSMTGRLCFVFPPSSKAEVCKTQ